MTDSLFLLAAGAIVIGYLLGSINFAIVVSGLLNKEDVRKKGSGNAGTTNMLRNYGWVSAAVTFLGDLLKGLLAVIVGKTLFSTLGIEAVGGYFGGLAALVGHMKPIFFGFRGGKGVATALGILLAADPLVFSIISLIGFPIAGITGYVSLASIICAGGYPFILLILQLFQNRLNAMELFLAFVLGWTIVYNHRDNIKRLRDGTENRFRSIKKR